ncbi:MAG: cation transporter [Oscillospiraceae bacterium]|nr:cation transporter [Oscillospiraceae bacterium]
MTQLLIKLFIPDYKNTTDKFVRERYGTLSGALGIICNVILFAVKLVIGTIMGSIAITSDAFNNLSDMGTSVMSVISAKMSNRHPDADHPFGHGRFEYISSLIISFLIMLVGFELFKSSLAKIFTPEPISMRPVLIIILALSILIKFWMFLYNRKMGKLIDSKVLKAAASDSLNDVFATSAVIVSSLAGYYLNLNIDGYIGCIVSVLIVIVGVKLAIDTVNILLGSAPSKEMVAQMEALLVKSPFVLGIHDLIIHDYGPGRLFASVHAEVSDKENVVVIHEEMDALEQEAMRQFGVELVIHMDPIATDCEVLNEVRDLVLGIVKSLGDYSIHDFRMTDGENRVNLIFDLVVPCTMTKKERDELLSLIRAALKEVDEKYAAVIQIDNDYTAQM